MRPTGDTNGSHETGQILAGLKLEKKEGEKKQKGKESCDAETCRDHRGGNRNGLRELK